MAGFFKKLFGIHSAPPPFDPESEISKLLALIPQCSQYVIVASNLYAKNYRCEVLVPATRLIPFAEIHASSVIDYCCCESDVAKVALLKWLHSASTNDGKLSYLPPPFVSIFNGFITDFINDGSAKIYCLECGHAIDHIDREEQNRITSGGTWACWTEVWLCPEGHLIYKQEHEMHFMRRRPKK